jgi:hypothetical protein
MPGIDTGASVSLTGCTITSNNNSSLESFIHLDGPSSNFSLVSSTITGNAFNNRGFIFNAPKAGTGDFLIDRCTISNNANTFVGDSGIFRIGLGDQSTVNVNSVTISSTEIKNNTNAGPIVSFDSSITYKIRVKDLSISNTIIENNDNDSGSVSVIHCGSQGTIQKMSLTNSSITDNNRGAIYCDGSVWQLGITNCSIERNIIDVGTSSLQSAGIVYVSYGIGNTTISNTVISGNVLRGNLYTRNGILYFNSLSANKTFTLKNSIIANNVLNQAPTLCAGGVIYIAGGTSPNTASIVNCVIYGNSVQGTWAPSVIIKVDVGGGNARLNNTIYWGNDASANNHTDGLLAYYNDVQTILLGKGSPSFITGNIQIDPVFENTATSDFHLQPTSPCIDVGNAGAVYNDPDGTRNDMGAYGGPGAANGIGPQP